MQVAVALLAVAMDVGDAGGGCAVVAIADAHASTLS